MLKQQLTEYIEENLEDEVLDNYGEHESAWKWKDIPFTSGIMAEDIIKFIDQHDTLLDKVTRAREWKK